MPKRLVTARLAASILSFLVAIGLVVLGAPNLVATLDVATIGTQVVKIGTQVATLGTQGGSLSATGLLLVMSGVALFILAVWLFCGYLHYRHEGR
jgi:hypothetical protein